MQRACDIGLACRLSDRALLARYHSHREAVVRDALVERYLPLAHFLARRHLDRGELLDDLVQVASVGLLKALDRFDPGRGCAFSTFAVPTIVGELKRHLRDKGWAVRVPRGLQDQALRVERIADDLTSRLGRSPTPGELAEAAGLTTEEVLDAREAAAAHYASSLERPHPDREDGGDLIAIEDHGYGRAEDAATIARLMRALPARDRAIVRLRFLDDLTQAQIAARVGVSQMHVCRLLRRSLARMREMRTPALRSGP